MRWTTRLAYKFLSPQTWSQIKFDWALSRNRWGNSAAKAASLLAGKRGLKLHLGCGKRILPGWVNIDAFDQPEFDLRWDFRDPFPCESGVAELAFSEHVLEHLEWDDAAAMLAEVLRLLSPGGRLRIGVPDAESYLRAYAEGRADFFHELRNIGNPSRSLDTPIEVINQMFRMGGHHRFAWDAETLGLQISRAGFADVRPMPSGTASIPELCLDDPAHMPGTLYVEGMKPLAAASNGHANGSDRR